MVIIARHHDIEADRKLMDSLYARWGLSDAPIGRRIEFLKNRTGYTSYHAGGNETPEEHLSALEYAFIEECI